MSTMSKCEHLRMIRSLFNIMIHGVSHDRLLIQMEEALLSPLSRKAACPNQDG